jgi:hypothetical protein
MGELDGNCEALKAESIQMEQYISSSKNTAVTPDNVEQLVFPANCISDKLIKL